MLFVPRNEKTLHSLGKRRRYRVVGLPAVGIDSIVHSVDFLHKVIVHALVQNAQLLLGQHLRAQRADYALSEVLISSSEEGAKKRHQTSRAELRRVLVIKGLKEILLVVIEALSTS